MDTDNKHIAIAQKASFLFLKLQTANRITFIAEKKPHDIYLKKIKESLLVPILGESEFKVCFVWFQGRRGLEEGEEVSFVLEVTAEAWMSAREGMGIRERRATRRLSGDWL